MNPLPISDADIISGSSLCELRIFPFAESPVMFSLFPLAPTCGQGNHKKVNYTAWRMDILEFNSKDYNTTLTHREKGVHAEELDGEMHRVVAQREAVLILEEERERVWKFFCLSFDFINSRPGGDLGLWDEGVNCLQK